MFDTSFRLCLQDSIEQIRRRRWLIRAQGWSAATTLGEQFQGYY
jgi:hypothetical protein